MNFFSGHCEKLSCPGEGFVGKDCTCWCPGNPVKACDGGGGGGGGGGGKVNLWILMS